MDRPIGVLEYQDIPLSDMNSALDPVNLAKRAFIVTELIDVNGRPEAKSDYRKIMDIVIGRSARPDSDKLERLLSSALNEGGVHGKLLENYFELEALGIGKATIHEGYDRLESVSKEGSWQERHLASLLLSILHLKGRDVLPGLEKANYALEAIPDDVEKRLRLETLYDTYSVMNNGFILDKSIDQALGITSRLLSLSAKINEYPDAFSISNNLAVLYSYGNRPELAIEILRTGESYLPKARLEQRVSFNYTLGFLLNQNQQYDMSEMYLKRALADSPPNMYLPYIYSNLAESYSHTGSQVQARELLTKIEELTREVGANTILENSVIRLKYTIASKEGDYETALRHLKRWSDRKITELNSEVFLNRQEAAEKLFVSARLSEQKLESLEIEAELKDTIIEREKKIRAFMTVIGLLIFILSMLLMYGVYKLRKSNREMSLARDEAVKGEKAKSEFLAMMSHEVRTPLNAIIPLSEQLISRAKDPSDRKLLNIMKSAGESMLFMMENIILFTTKETLDRKYFVDVDMHEAVKTAVLPFRGEIKANELSLNAKSVVKDRMVLSNPRALNMILGNILSNAIKFTKEGVVNIEYQGNRNEIIVVVTDTGEGFDVTKLDEMLQPFVQADNSISRKYGGAGIGLAATNVLIKQLDGTLQIDSKIGQGTKVTVTIPRGKPTDQAIAA